MVKIRLSHGRIQKSGFRGDCSLAPQDQGLVAEKLIPDFDAVFVDAAAADCLYGIAVENQAAKIKVFPSFHLKRHAHFLRFLSRVVNPK